MPLRQLFESCRLGRLPLPNRVVMAPLTRCRATNPGLIPTPLMAEYYEQRSSAGLIISEGAPVSAQALGYAFTPGLYTADQVAGWRRVTATVHDVGGRIFAQLWHCGRRSHSSLREDQSPPVGPSTRTAQGKTMALDRDTGRAVLLPCDPPRALATAEVEAVIRDFAAAARNALEAGFDGVEIHGANGYLLDQFRCPYLNDRSDRYGGSLENRCRLHIDVARAVVDTVGAERVGLRLSPLGQANDMQPDPEPLATYGYLAQELSRLGLAYLHVYDQSATWIHDPDSELLQLLRQSFGGALLLCGGFDGQRAAAALAAGTGDLIVFGKPFISNPDLVERLSAGLELAPWDTKTFYQGGAAGYTDYPPFAA